MLAIGIHFEAAGDADLASLKLPPTIIDMIGIIGNLRVRSAPGEMLQIVISNPQFAWLRRISELIVEIDEVLDSQEPTALTAATDLLMQTRALLVPGDAGDFARKYHDALQRQPDAVLAHKDVAEILAPGDH